MVLQEVPQSSNLRATSRLGSSRWTEPQGNQIYRRCTEKWILEAEHKVILGIRCTLKLVWQCRRMQTTKVQIPAPSSNHMGAEPKHGTSQVLHLKVFLVPPSGNVLLWVINCIWRRKNQVSRTTSWNLTADRVQLFIWLSLRFQSGRPSSAGSPASWLWVIDCLRWVGHNPSCLTRNHGAWQAT